MPKRSGLGQRGLDLLISASTGTPASDSDDGKKPAAKNAGEKKATEKKPATIKTSQKKSAAGKPVTKKAAEKKPAAEKPETKKGAETKSAAEKPVTKKAAKKKAAAEKPATKKEAEKKPAAAKPMTEKQTVNGSAGKKSADRTLSSGEQTKERAIEKTMEKTEEERFSSDKGNPVMVPISMVEPNREQPRKNFDEDALQELADSIRQFGVIQPLIVQEKDGYYEIIAGERRWRAARIASLKEVPVIIREYTTREVMEISLIENLQREDLNPIEEAAAFRRLMEEYQMKQDEVAQRVSKSRAAIANSVRLLNLDKRVQDMVVAEMLSTGHARALLAVTDPEQQFQMAQKVFDEKLTVRDVEKLVRRMNEAPASPVRKQISDALQAVYESLAEQMKSSLGTKVSIAPRSAQKGKIEIEYYSSDELDRLCTLLNSLSQREGV